MPRNKQQNEQARDARKEQIRAEALKQFATKGLGAARIQDIAAGVGVAQDVTRRRLAEDALDKLIESTEKVQGMRGTARDKLVYSLRILLGTIEQDERFAQTCCLLAQSAAPLKLSESDREFLEEKRLFPYHILAEIIHEGQAEGSVVDGEPMELSLLFWSVVNGLAVHRVSHEKPLPMPNFNLAAAMFLKP